MTTTQVNESALVPTPTMIHAAEKLILFGAYEDAVRPYVESYERAILARYQFKLGQEYRDLGMPDRPILEGKEVHLLDEEQARIFERDRKAACAASGLGAEDGRGMCPLRAAEALRIEAENRLLEVMSRERGMGALQQWRTFSPEQRTRGLELCLHQLMAHLSPLDEIFNQLTPTATPVH